MSHAAGLDRRAFLKRAGMTAVAGATATVAAFPIGAIAADARPDDRFDFDTPYNRIGTDSTKWDKQILVYVRGNIAVGMGVADLDFKVAPAITRALSVSRGSEKSVPDGALSSSSTRPIATSSPRATRTRRTPRSRTKTS